MNALSSLHCRDLTKIQTETENPPGKPIDSEKSTLHAVQTKVEILEAELALSKKAVENFREKERAWNKQRQDLRSNHAHSIALLKSHNENRIEREQKASEKRQNEVMQYQKAMARQRHRLASISMELHNQQLEQASLSLETEEEMATQLRRAESAIADHQERTSNLQSQLAHEKRARTATTQLLKRANEQLSRLRTTEIASFVKKKEQTGEMISSGWFPLDDHW